MLPYSRLFDQHTLTLMVEHDAIVQRYRTMFALIDWQLLPDPVPDPSRPGRRPHPESAYIKALLIKIHEGFEYCSQVRTFLVEHPLLVLELGFRPELNRDLPYGFDVQRTVPTERWLREKQRTLDHGHLQDLFHATVHALQEEIPGLGEVVAIDVKHQYAWVRENNPRESIKDRFCKERQPAGDPDCRVGVKSSTNQEQPDGSKKERKEYLWGYGSGIATATTPDYGDMVIADLTQPFNASDVSYFLRLYIQTVAVLGVFPLHLTADAAYDAWYVYQTCAHRAGIMAIPKNGHGHEDVPRDPDGMPLCSRGLRMHPTYRFLHTKGYHAQRYRCPLLFPQRTAETCTHEQFTKDKGCVKDINIEKGGLMRAMLDRSSPLYRAVYRQRTSAERINSQAKARCIERPKVRQGHSVKRLNTLTYIVINEKRVGTRSGHQRFLAHAQLDARIVIGRRLAQGRSSAPRQSFAERSCRRSGRSCCLPLGRVSTWGLHNRSSGPGQEEGLVNGAHEPEAEPAATTASARRLHLERLADFDLYNTCDCFHLKACVGTIELLE